MDPLWPILGSRGTYSPALLGFCTAWAEPIHAQAGPKETGPVPDMGTVGAE